MKASNTIFMPTNKGNHITVQIKLSVKTHTKNPCLLNACVVFVMPFRVFIKDKNGKYMLATNMLRIIYFCRNSADCSRAQAHRKGEQKYQLKMTLGLLLPLLTSSPLLQWYL